MTSASGVHVNTQMHITLRVWSVFLLLYITLAVKIFAFGGESARLKEVQHRLGAVEVGFDVGL